MSDNEEDICALPEAPDAPPSRTPEGEHDEEYDGSDDDATSKGKRDSWAMPPPSRSPTISRASTFGNHDGSSQGQSIDPPDTCMFATSALADSDSDSEGDVPSETNMDRALRHAKKHMIKSRTPSRSASRVSSRRSSVGVRKSGSTNTQGPRHSLDSAVGQAALEKGLLEAQTRQPTFDYRHVEMKDA